MNRVDYEDCVCVTICMLDDDDGDARVSITGSMYQRRISRETQKNQLTGTNKLRSKSTQMSRTIDQVIQPIVQIIRIID